MYRATSSTENLTLRFKRSRALRLASQRGDESSGRCTGTWGKNADSAVLECWEQSGWRGIDHNGVSRGSWGWVVETSKLSKDLAANDRISDTMDVTVRMLRMLCGDGGRGGSREPDC